MMLRMKPQQTDPLFVIFEQHLFNFQDPEIDRKTLIGRIVTDYLSYLRKKNITVPRSLEQPIVEELSHQVNVMLVKKIYGCLTLQGYQQAIEPSVKKRARKRYTKLADSQPARRQPSARKASSK